MPPLLSRPWTCINLMQFASKTLRPAEFLSFAKYSIDTYLEDATASEKFLRVLGNGGEILHRTLSTFILFPKGALEYFTDSFFIRMYFNLLAYTCCFLFVLAFKLDHFNSTFTLTPVACD